MIPTMSKKGKKTKIISDGGFATDEIVNTLLKNFITNSSYRNRIIFDGYPRNTSQAKNLEQILDDDNQSIKSIFFLNVSRQIIEKRIIGRIKCEKCNKILNEYYNADEIENHKCGKNYLKKRKDDNQEAIITRYDAYMEKTKPVLDFYANRTNFFEIDARVEIDEITRKIEEIIKSFKDQTLIVFTKKGYFYKFLKKNLF